MFVFLGSVFKLGHVLDFSDMMLLGMAFPNILGAVILSGKVKPASTTTGVGSSLGRCRQSSEAAVQPAVYHPRRRAGTPISSS